MPVIRYNLTMLRCIVLIFLAALGGAGCTAVATPDIQATVAVTAATATLTPAPDIETTVEARLKSPTLPIQTATSPPNPTHTPIPTAESSPPDNTPVPTPAYTPAPTPTPIRTPVPISAPTLIPTPTVRPNHPPTLTPTPTNDLQLQNPVFYQQNGLTLEFYWPLSDLSNLSADETEILAYNETGEVIEFKAPKMTFTENGIPRAQFSGTWEKFPSRFSWDRIEYISIPPSPYQGEPLLVYPGEKAKIHWHLEGIASTDTNQSVSLTLTVETGARTETITQTLVRDSEQRDTSVATAPEATRELHETQQSTGTDVHSESAETTSGVLWSFDGASWSPGGPPPDCAEPFVLQTPVDLNMVTAALWPGQVRGGYVAHGGFRFDANDDNNVTVRAPIGSHLVQASQYLASGEKQYLLFFSVPCGFFYRFDHVRVVAPKLAEALKDLPPATPGDSRTTYINPPVWIEQGEVVGTSIGISLSNIFVDFGLYDVRTPNNVIPNPDWADLYAADKEFGHYGVCFFDYLPAAHGEILRSLPTGIEGKTSDYCR